MENQLTRPGPVKWIPPLRQFTELKPLRRTGVPDDIAAGVRFLAGPESSWITGQSIGIEGGHELTMAPDMGPIARALHGDTDIDTALEGRILGR